MPFFEHEAFIWLSAISALIALFGVIYHWIGLHLIREFCQHEAELQPLLTKGEKKEWPRISVFKPLYGDIPLLKEALETLLNQDYPYFEIIFGVHDAKDPAVKVVEALQQAYPTQEIKIVISPTKKGMNQKVINLGHIQKRATSDIFVIADADIHVPPYWLKYIIQALQTPKTALVTAPYAGISAHAVNPWQSFSRLGINSSFLPGVLVSRYLGRQDCFGATMALTRQKLEELGGFEALESYVADDAKLANTVRKTDENVALLPALTLTSVTENSFQKLIQHELRWGRTTKSVQPIAYAASILQFSLVWSALALLFHPSWLFLTFFFFCLFSRWINVLCSENLLIPKEIQAKSELGKLCYAASLLPIIFLREWMGALVILISFLGSKVHWAGHILFARSIRKKPPVFQDEVE
ncbi:glycosyltransferase [Acetobacteraceae bacterium]|nr:glycosyltransferase [Acetobacteraceae bacterium]